MSEKVGMSMGLIKGTYIDAYCVVGHPLAKNESQIMHL